MPDFSDVDYIYDTFNLTDFNSTEQVEVALSSLDVFHVTWATITIGGFVTLLIFAGSDIWKRSKLQVRNTSVKYQLNIELSFVLKLKIVQYFSKYL